MHREESDQLVTCIACGGVVDPRDRVFELGSEGALCFACALERGGTYDARQERWTRSPDVSDVAEPEL
jgi:hypothetical protein